MAWNIQIINLELKKQGFNTIELEVASLLIQGLSNLEIGNQLFISETMVKVHLANIYQKQGVKSRVPFIVHYLKTGEL